MTISSQTLVSLMSGGLVAGYLVAGLYFWKFWRVSRDRLFVFFAAALCILALQRLLLSLSEEVVEEQTLFYVLRLLAYLLLIGGIVQKNLSARKGSATAPGTRQSS